MKRGKKLFALLLALVLILGATYAVTLLNPENTVEETVYNTVFSVDADAVTQISWDYKELLSFTKEDDIWVYDKDAAFPLDVEFINTMLENLKEIQSAKTIENVEDWDQYTLEVPICKVTVTADGETHTIKIGEETSLGGERYLSIGDGNAYLVDSNILDVFNYGLYDVLKMESIPEMEEIQSMEHTSQNGTYQILRMENSGLAYSDEYVWFINEKPLDTELTVRLMTYVTGMSWVECVDYSAENLQKYGLDEPAAVTVMRYTDREGTEQAYALEIGGPMNNNYYARIQGSHMVYRISTSTAEKLIYTTYEELQPDEVLLMDWDQVTALEILLDGESYKITRSVETVTDDTGKETEKIICKLDGEEVDADSILDGLDDLESTGYAAGLTPERSEEIRFIIHRNHATFPEVELAIYQYNSTSCMVTLNGAATVFISREETVDLVEEVHALVLK